MKTVCKGLRLGSILLLALLLVCLQGFLPCGEDHSALAAAKNAVIKFHVHYEDDMENIMGTRSSVYAKVTCEGLEDKSVYIYAPNSSSEYTGSVTIPLYDEATGEAYQYTFHAPTPPRGYQLGRQEFDPVTNTWHYYMQWTGKRDFTATITMDGWNLASPLADVTDLEFQLDLLSDVYGSNWSMECGAPDSTTYLGDGKWQATWKDILVGHPDVDKVKGEWSASDDVLEYRIRVNCDPLTPWYGSSTTVNGETHYTASNTNTGATFTISQNNLRTLKWLLRQSNSMELSKYVTSPYKDWYDLSPYSIWLVDENGAEVPGSRKPLELTSISSSSGSSFGGTALSSYSWVLPGYDENGVRNKNYLWYIKTDFTTNNLPPYWSQRSIYYGDTLHIGAGYFSIYHEKGFLTWEDNANALGLRPTSFPYRFRLADGYEDKPGSEYIQTAEFTWSSSVSVYGDTRVTYPLYDLEGNELDYVMEAENPSPYYVMELVKDYDVRSGEEPLSSTSDYRTKRYKLVMTLPTRKITASVNFQNETENGKNRPKSMAFDITYADGSPVPFKKTTRSVDAGTNWIAEWEVPLYDAQGKLAEYKITPITNPPLHALTPDSPVVTTSTDAETGETTENHAFTYVEQENWNYAIDLIWDKSDPTQWYELYEVVQTNNQNRDAKYKLTIRVNAAQYDVGKLEVRLPYYMVGVKSDNKDAYIAPAGIGVPKDPLYNASNPFNYYIDDHGTDDLSDDEIVFKNWTPITDSINQTIEVQYTVCPSQMRDTVPSAFQATGKGIATYQNAAGEQVEQPAEVKTTRPITFGIDNGHYSHFYIRSSKIVYEGERYQMSSGMESITPTEHDKYIYIGYWLYCSYSFNQFFTGELQLELPEGAHVVKIDKNCIFDPNPIAENTWKHKNIVYPSTNVYRPESYDEFQVLVAYPRTNPGAEDEQYEVWLKGTYTTHTLHEHENDKVEGLDFNDEDVTPDDVIATWTPKKPVLPSGNIYSAYKYGSSMPEYGIEYFNAGTDITTPYFYAYTTVNGNLLKRPFQIITTDDAMFARMTTTGGTVTDWVQLTAEDYTFRKAEVYVSWSRFDTETQSTVYDNVPRGEFILQGQTAYGDQWEEVARFELPENMGTSSSYRFYFDDPAMFEGKNYTGLRVMSPQGLTGSVSLYLYVYTTFLADSPLYQSYIADNATKIEFDNYSAHYIYVLDPETNEYEWFNGYSAPYITEAASINGLNAKDLARLNHYVLRNRATLSTGYTSKNSGITKKLVSTYNDNVNSKVDVRFSVNVYEGHRSADSIPGYFDEIAWQEGVFYDLLPPGYTLNESAGIRVTGGTTSLPCSLVKVETVDNYKDSGRQLVRFYVQYDGEKGTNYAYITSSGGYYGPAFNIEYSASISWTEWSYAPSGYNFVAFQEGHGEKGQPIYGARQDDGAYFNQTSFGTDMQEIMSDLNGDGDTTGNNTLCSSLYFSVDVVGAYATGVNKLVKANSGYYRMHDVADLSGEYSYKISFTASEGGTTRDLVLFDILEEAANTGTTNGVANANEIWWEGTLTGIDTGLPSRQGIQPRVFYSTSASLTYGDIDKALNDDKTPVLDYLADDSVWKEWTSANPPADLSAVTALAFDLTTDQAGEPYAFEGSSATYVEIFMQAPATLPQAVLAYNRPSYYTTFTTGAQHSAGTSTHNINDRVTVELRDLKDFSFTKLGEYDQVDGVKEYKPLSGICFQLFRCSHECDTDCADICVHTHSTSLHASGSCWGGKPIRTTYSLADGSVNFTKLDSGSYAIYENGTRTGFTPLSDMWWIIDVEATVQGGVSKPVNGGVEEPHVSMEQNADGGYSLKNDRIRKTMNVRKSWRDEKNDKSYRPDRILIDLYRNNELIREGIEFTFPNSYYTTYTFVLNDLYSYSFEGKSNSYTIEEHFVPGYQATIELQNNQFNLYNDRLGIMQLSKQVVDGDTARDFTFRITLEKSGKPVAGDFTLLKKDAQGEQTSSAVTADQNGVLTVSLSHGETITVLDIPIGASYSIEEVPVPGYTPEFTQGEPTGTIESGTVHMFAITNTYTSKGTLNLQAMKTVNGQPIAEDVADKFTFLLTGTDGASQQKQNDANGVIAFDAIEYDLDDDGKSFLYTVKEQQDECPGYTLDDREFSVAVWVSDKGDGTMDVRKSIQTGGRSMTEIVFDNTYVAAGEWQPTASKSVNGQQPREDQVYEFLLTGNGEELLSENSKDQITFDTLKYDLSDAGQTYIYTVQEITSPTDLLATDETCYTVEVTITDNRDGTLNVKPVFLREGEQAEAVAFANTLYAPLTISKTVEGCETDSAFAMTVQLFDADGTELTGSYACTGDVEGEITSGSVIGLSHGQSVTILGLLPGMTYAVEEAAAPAFTTTVNGSAASKAEGALVEGGNEVSFVNTFRTTSFTVTKRWQGGGGGAIELTLYANGEKVLPQPVYTRDGDTYIFAGLPMYSAQDEFIVYSAKEKYVDGFTTIYNNVSPYSDQTSAVYDGGTIINKAIVKADFTVKKAWTGLNENETAPSITLVLYCNGVATDVQTPTPDRHGWYKYYDLPNEVDGEPAVYTVKEESLEGYETSYTLANGDSAAFADNGGTITNARVPATGDAGRLLLWSALLAVSAALLLILRRKKA